VRNSLFILLQYITPQSLLTYLVGKLANSKNRWVKNTFIRFILKRYPINLDEALDSNIDHYATFNDFFIRQLKPGCRPIPMAPNIITSPADGTIAALGKMNNNLLLQAKQFYFTLESLLGGDTLLANTFCNGNFMTIYLAPHNYHRVHMPITGTLEKSIFIPGKLFSVNKITTDFIPQLYSRNERLVTIFNTEIGKVAVILVGAMIVGSIKTVWSEGCSRRREITQQQHDPLTLEKGAEMGYFEMGSTVILLFEPNKVTWNPALQPSSNVQLGNEIGFITTIP
jgi:phosphatidylserine decarboxylase